MDEDGKVCATCTQWQPLTEFNRRARSKDGLQSRCRDCSRAWYVLNAEAHKANTSRRAREAREQYRQRVFAYLSAHPCVDCGLDDIVVLEFDHRDPGTKAREVAKLVNDLVAWSTIEAEIDKCDVCCANCHRRRTAERGDQRRHRYQREGLAADREQALRRLARVLPG